MTWKLAQGDHKRYQRNPLQGVIAQLRFQPILRIAKDMATFQDLVRKDFPRYGTKTESELKANLNKFEVREEEFFLFSDDKGRVLSLTTSHMTLESRRYESHTEFIGKFLGSLRALEKLFEPIEPTRLGLRYVNVVDRGQLSEDLGLELRWQELVDERFLQLPNGLLDDEDTNFSNEIAAPVGNGGKLFLRYGLQASEDRFFFDMDRYIEADELRFENISELLGGFSDQCSYLYSQMVAGKLELWMNGEEKRC